MDLAYHFFVAYAIVLIIASSTIYLGDISIDLFFYSFLLALLMIPVRIIAIRCKEIYYQNTYLKKVLDEILYTDDNRDENFTSPESDNDDDDDWFMKIAREN